MKVHTEEAMVWTFIWMCERIIGTPYCDVEFKEIEDVLRAL